MSRVIVVTGGKGGVGKTALTANLGAALAREGQKVAVMDVDIGLNNLDVALGVESRVVYDLVDVIENRCRPRQALLETECSGLYLMPSAHPYDRGKVNGQNIKYVVNILSETFDFIFLDCPAGVEAGFHRAVAAASEAVLVTTPHIAAIRDACKVIPILASYGLSAPYIVVNRMRGDLVMRGEMLGYADIEELFGLPLTGIIPEDDTVGTTGGLAAESADGRKGGAAHDAYGLLAQNILTGSQILYDCTARYRGFWGGLRRRLRKIT
jgi:septum site-determining protein MinD